MTQAIICIVPTDIDASPTINIQSLSLSSIFPTDMKKVWRKSVRRGNPVLILKIGRIPIDHSTKTHEELDKMKPTTQT